MCSLSWLNHIRIFMLANLFKDGRSVLLVIGVGFGCFAGHGLLPVTPPFMALLPGLVVGSQWRYI